MRVSLSICGNATIYATGARPDLKAGGLNFSDRREPPRREDGIMDVYGMAEFDAHEAIHIFHNKSLGLRFIVAIHNTTRGPAVGGCRMWNYPSFGDALGDALRLSRGMTYKAALADLPYGGGKSVLIGDVSLKSPAVLGAVGEAVESLAGQYTISDDLGVSLADVAVIAASTRFACAPRLPDGTTIPATAFGVFHGIRATALHVFGTDDIGRRSVAVQGLGAVGSKLCEYLADAGATLFVADLDPERVTAAVRRWNARPMAVEEILFAAVDILAPCALGGILNAGTIGRLRCRAIAGAANNQLATPENGVALAARGITYAPDFVINAGGLIEVAHLRSGVFEMDGVLDDCRRIFDRTLNILGRAAASGEDPSSVAERFARERLPAKRRAVETALDASS